MGGGVSVDEAAQLCGCRCPGLGVGGSPPPLWAQRGTPFGGRGNDIVTYNIDRKSTTPTSATYTASSARFGGRKNRTIRT
ncbi:MAG: hypothetical protein CM1200mP29_03740 [Verrucomicrobiota bacterium]|nr:MAG: hypothetical protein CM1200mP29_03740 [Verrucomicrobiota bacterium]